MLSCRGSSKAAFEASILEIDRVLDGSDMGFTVKLLVERGLRCLHYPSIYLSTYLSINIYILKM